MQSIKGTAKSNHFIEIAPPGAPTRAVIDVNFISMVLINAEPGNTEDEEGEVVPPHCRVTIIMKNGRSTEFQYPDLPNALPLYNDILSRLKELAHTSFQQPIEPMPYNDEPERVDDDDDFELSDNMPGILGADGRPVVDLDEDALPGSDDLDDDEPAKH